MSVAFIASDILVSPHHDQTDSLIEGACKDMVGPVIRPIESFRSCLGNSAWLLLLDRKCRHSLKVASESILVVPVVAVHSEEIHEIVSRPPVEKSCSCTIAVVAVHLRRNGINEVSYSLYISEILDGEPPELDEFSFCSTLRAPPRPCLSMLMIRSEDDWNQLSIRTFQIVGKISASVKPLEILGTSSTAFSEYFLYYIIA